MTAPIASKYPHQLQSHGFIRSDDYYWLRNRDDPEVRAYLEAENTYVSDVMTATLSFEKKLFKEIKGRIKQTDMSAPYQDGSFYYYRRYEDGKEYPIYCRQVIKGSSSEQIVLDVNKVADGKKFCDVSALEVSSNECLLAYAVDTVGRRFYTIKFIDLETGCELQDSIQNVTSNIVWATDSKTFFYTKQDPETLRSYQVYRHRLGTNSQEDKLIFQEHDPTFNCGVGRSRSKRYILVSSFQTLTTEYRYLDADYPCSDLALFLPRQRGHEYDIDHFDGHFYIRTNKSARNFKLMSTNEKELEPYLWHELISHREDVLIEGYELFRDHLVIEERVEGLSQIRIRQWSDGSEHKITFNEPAYEVHIDINRESDTSILRFCYSSMTTPSSVYDYDMISRERTLLKREDVVGDFNAERYESIRLFANSHDGVRVPISLVRRREMTDELSPLLLYGYGAYGISTEPIFRSSSLSLLDRGFVFAIAHVRGGEELGRSWYEEGKLLKKKNTFNDFIVCAEHLVAEGYTSANQLFAMGGSAGGLLMGAVINERPDLFHGIVAQVPFVDVLTTMLDESIPLTTGEYDEWGDPNDLQYYEYIRSYSPYDNVTDVTWPHLLVMTGLHDSQVQYWEPAKWVAKRRSVKRDNRRLLLKTNMDAGHGGASGRYQQYRELALQYTFLLDLVDRAK